LWDASVKQIDNLTGLRAFAALSVFCFMHATWNRPAGTGSLGPLLIFFFWLKVPYFDYLFGALTVSFVLCLFKAGPIWLYASPVGVYGGRISYSFYMSHIITILTIEAWPARRCSRFRSSFR
jgi:peptidoglycan/LPS O-acetylase OafA/YrhL